MKNISKVISILLILSLCLGLAACGSTNKDNSSSATDVPAVEETPVPETPAPEEEEPEVAAPQVDSELPVNVMVLNGTTGFGMAKLISDAGEGNAALNYNFSIESDAANITAAIINGSADIAALPTNAASVLYNKTEGGVQLLALNTLGVLYLVVNGETEDITSIADLAGKTVYAPAQNPSFIFSYICQQNGLEDVTIDNTYAQPADLRTAVASGEVDIAVLPEPMVTIAKSTNDKLVVALDLTEEWDAVAPAKDSLVQGCVVVRAQFAQEHPAEVAAFLSEYEASIAFLTEDTAAAGEIIEATGVFAKGAVAAKAIPNCNVCFIAGEDMVQPMSQFLEIMFDVAPASIGGAVPGEDFYYIAG
jgi:NitT/TauT family transport system substrate-binding protein